MPTISQTERTILLLLSYGRSHRRIARQLKLAPDEVTAGVAAARRKLRARTDCHAIAKAMRRRLVPLRPRASTLKKLALLTAEARLIASMRKYHGLQRAAEGRARTLAKAIALS